MANFSAATRVANGPKYCALRLFSSGDARGDRRARVRIVENQLDQRRETQAQTLIVGLGEFAAQGLVEQKRRFKVGAGGCPFDPANALAQIELAALSIGEAEQALQAAAQVRSLADVGLAGLILTAQQKHRRTRRHGGEEVSVAVGSEFEAVRCHQEIVFHHGDTEGTEKPKQETKARNQSACHPERAAGFAASRRAPIPA